MKQATKTILPLTALAILLVSVSPLAYASTLTVNLNPKTGLAKLDSTSTTKITFTYPSNSTISKYLRNVSSSYTSKGQFTGSDSGTQLLQGSFDDEDSHISVRNMTVSVSYSAKGSATELVVNKQTNVSAWVSGAFSVVNGSVTANLGWRAFVVRGAMDLPLEGRTVDVNLVGSSMEDSIATHYAAAAIFLGAFGGGTIWNRPTLNFSALNTPLSTWTKNYDSATNTTTFSKTISGQSNFTASVDYNGQKYSLSAVSDPSGVVRVQGYANAQGDSLVMAASPPASSGSFLAVGAALVVLAGLGYMVFRSRAKMRTSPSTTPNPV
jgi:hypothetical protein